MAVQWILQLCHGYSGPFLDVARQYAALFRGSDYKVLTVYLTGKACVEVEAQSSSDDVLFLEYSSREVRGLKLAAIRDLRKISDSRDFALAIAHRFKPIYIACLATRLPVIGVHHAFGGYDRPQRRWFAHMFRNRLLLLAVSDAVRDEMRRLFPTWPLERIETLHNRLDMEVIQSEILPQHDARRMLNLPPDANVVANVGRLHPDKDQTTLIDGFALALPNLPLGTLLVIAGKGPLEEDLINQVRDYGLQDSVRFLGQIPQIRRLFAAFDVFVLSSDHEPFGMVVLESLAAGVPVIATNCGGAPEILDSPEMYFGLRDSSQLAARLVAYFSSCHESDQRAKFAAKASERLRHKFSDDSARRRFFSLPGLIAIGFSPK